jgi:hypothetical protein
MRTSEAFVLGAIMGQPSCGCWDARWRSTCGQETRGVRTTVAEGVRGVEEKTGQMLDRGGDALRRAGDFLQATKAHVSETLRAGEDAIRPASAPRNV